MNIIVLAMYLYQYTVHQMRIADEFLLVVGLTMLGGFVVLAKVYFFSVPLTGISISLACYVASIAVSRALIMRS